MNMSLEEMLEKINFQSLKHVYTDYGHKYVLKTWNYGSSYPCDDLEQIKKWIVDNIGWQLK